MKMSLRIISKWFTLILVLILVFVVVLFVSYQNFFACKISCNHTKEASKGLTQAKIVTYHGANATYTGPTSLEGSSFENLAVTGPAHLKNIKAHFINITGPLHVEEVSCGTLQVIGPIQASHLQVGQAILVGPTKASISKFGNLTITADEIFLEDSSVGNITIKKDQDKVQKLYLRAKTFVKGDIVFESGKGQIIMHKDSLINGTIKGAQIETE